MSRQLARALEFLGTEEEVSVQRSTNNDFDRIISEFELVAEYASARSLRELVLNLAMRGLLVPQVPAEGTSESLVARLQRERPRMGKTTKLAAEAAPVLPEQRPYEIPHTWSWIRLSQLGGFLGGGTPSKANAEYWQGSIPWVTPKDMKRPIISDAEDHISEAAITGSAAKRIPAGSVLFVLRGMILAHSFPVALTAREVTINQDMRALVLGAPETAEYVLRFCQGARLRVLKHVERSSHGTCRLDSAFVEDLPVPLPPLAEQKRIVAKVKELLALVTMLEENLLHSVETKYRLRPAVMDALAQTESFDEREAAWQRTSANFDVLFSSTRDVESLRQSLIDLASRGRLVPQSRTDCAVEAIRHLRAIERREAWEVLERKRLARNGKKPTNDSWKNNYVEPKFTIPESMPSLPKGWCYLALGELGADPFNPVQTGPFGAQLHSSEFVASGVPVIAVGNLTGTGFTQEGLCFIERSKAEHLSRYDVRANDLLFARSGATLGKVCVAPEYVDDWRMTGHILRVRLDPRVISAELAAFWLWASAAVKTQITDTIRGGTRPGYNTALLENIVIPIPPLAEQTRISARLTELLQQCDALEARLRARDALAEKLAASLVAQLTQ